MNNIITERFIPLTLSRFSEKEVKEYENSDRFLYSSASRWFSVETINPYDYITNELNQISQNEDSKNKKILSSIFECLALIIYSYKKGNTSLIDGQIPSADLDLNEIIDHVKKNKLSNKNDILPKFINLFKPDGSFNCAINTDFISIDTMNEWILMSKWMFWASNALELFGKNDRKDLIWRVSSRMEGGDEKHYHRGRNMTSVKGLLKTGQRAHRREIIYEMIRAKMNDGKSFSLKRSRCNSSDDSVSTISNEVSLLATHTSIPLQIDTVEEVTSCDESSHNSCSASFKLESGSYKRQRSESYCHSTINRFSPTPKEVIVDPSVSKVFIIVKHVYCCKKCCATEEHEVLVNTMNSNDTDCFDEYHNEGTTNCDKSYTESQTTNDISVDDLFNADLDCLFDNLESEPYINQ